MLSFLHSPTLTPYMTTRKTIDLTRRSFAGKVMSLLLNMLSRLVIAFLPRSKRLLITLLMPSKNLCRENNDFQFLITEFWNWCYFFFSLVWADICNNEQWNFVECWLYQLDKLFLSLEINKNYLFFQSIYSKTKNVDFFFLMDSFLTLLRALLYFLFIFYMLFLPISMNPLDLKSKDSKLSTLLIYSVILS